MIFFTQRLLHALTARDVSDNPANCIDPSALIPQRELDDDARMQTIVIPRSFFELSRLPRFQNLTIIDLKLLGLLPGKQFDIRFPQHASRLQAECLLKPAVDIQIATIPSFDEHEVGRVIEKCAEQVLTPAQQGAGPGTYCLAPYAVRLIDSTR